MKQTIKAMEKNLTMIREDLEKLKKERRKRIISTEIITLAIMAAFGCENKIARKKEGYYHTKEAVITQNDTRTIKEIGLVHNEKESLKIYYQSPWLTTPQSNDAYQFRINAQSMEDLTNYLNALKTDQNWDEENKKVNVEISKRPKDQVDCTEPGFTYEEYINQDKKVYIPLNREINHQLDILLISELIIMEFISNIYILPSILLPWNERIKYGEERKHSLEKSLEIDIDK
jgi:hypothetical protein